MHDRDLHCGLRCDAPTSSDPGSVTSPIAREMHSTDDRGMTELAIRCRVRDEESGVRFEQWLGQKRAASPILMTDGTVRASRLTPGGTFSIGWYLDHDQMSESSFPASDSPAVWIRETRALRSVDGRGSASPEARAESRG
jgi:hypothetical protein